MEDNVWTCPLDLKSKPSATRHETCADNNQAGPTKAGVENKYAKIMSGSCWGRIWTKLLQVEVSSKKSGSCMTVAKWLQSHSDESENSISVGLMNEPNMVKTKTLAKAYHDVISDMRGQGVTNRVLVGGNYWMGLHAQWTPTSRNEQRGSRSAS